MCGIAGLVKQQGVLQSPEELRKMAHAIRHRGPDDVGYLFGQTHSGNYRIFGDDDTPAAVLGSNNIPYTPNTQLNTDSWPMTFTIGLAARRLAVLDLTPAGHQPMCNEDGLIWIVYNGEIYNHQELRHVLHARGHQFRSRTDTETIIHAYEEWGIGCVARFNGMWAFALWDVRRRQLWLSRDRVGIKPLYLHYTKSHFAFASEIKGLLALGLPRRAHLPAVADFLIAGLTDHTPATFFQEITTLPAAHNLCLNLETGAVEMQHYWTPGREPALRSVSDADYAAAFHDLFTDAVRVHLISDVPIGTCLSGGLDSSAVTTVIDQLVRQQDLHVNGMEARQKTFSARYADPHHDEGRFIESVITMTRVEAHTVYPSADGLRSDWRKIFYHLEEPFASTSIFAQWEVFKLARRSGVTVTLDGQGGDELLAGYLGLFPPFHADLAACLDWRRLLNEFSAHLTRHNIRPLTAIRALATNLLPIGIRTRLKASLMSRASWVSPMLRYQFSLTVPVKADRCSRLKRAQLAEITANTLPSLLRFDDRNSMAHSIESRVPFLDARLLDFCLALPDDQKIRGGISKFILRQALRDVLPKAIYHRQDKIGFSTPQSTWLRELTPWLKEIFESPDFRQRPYWRPEAIQAMLIRHAAGQDHSAVLWRCLAVELWHRAMEVRDEPLAYSIRNRH